MTKPKLFLYPNARPHEHDLNPSQVFVNTVPMSRVRHIGTLRYLRP